MRFGFEPSGCCIRATPNYCHDIGANGSCGKSDAKTTARGVIGANGWQLLFLKISGALSGRQSFQDDEVLALETFR